MRSAFRPALLALAALLVTPPCFAQAKPNPYIDPAARLYQSLEFGEALRTVEKAVAFPGSTPEEEVRAALLEGLITAQLGKTDRAVGAFKRGLALDPDAKLPFKVPPKISRLFDKARAELKALPAQKPVKAEAKVEPPKPGLLPPPVIAAPPPLVTVHAVEAHPPQAASPVETVRPVEPERSDRGVMASVAFISDVTAPSRGAELGAGYHLGGLEASLRLRPGHLTGVGLLASWNVEFGRGGVFAGLRGDLYLGAPTIPGGGAVLGGRYAAFGPLGFVASASFEKFGAAPGLRSFGSVLSAGLEFRQ